MSDEISASHMTTYLQSLPCWIVKTRRDSFVLEVFGKFSQVRVLSSQCLFRDEKFALPGFAQGS